MRKKISRRIFLVLGATSAGIAGSAAIGNQADYRKCCADLETKRTELANTFPSENAVEREKIIAAARHELLRFFAEDCFPAWYGTPWDFNGTTETPGEGKIACGYFVSTTLLHAGFRMNRYKIAQQASQKIVQVFAEKEDIQITAGKPVSSVVEHLETNGPGLYIVGLDTHVGYLMHHEGEKRFIHSSYYRPDAFVKSEPLEGHNPLADSNYRVVGKILGDKMISKWLRGEAFEL